MPRSIEVLKNDRKNHSVRSMFTGRNRRIAVFGDRTIFLLRAVDFSFRFDNRFFDADSIDLDASIDRGAQKRSTFSAARIRAISAPSYHSSNLFPIRPRDKFPLLARARALPSPSSFPLPLFFSPSSFLLSFLFSSFSSSFLPSCTALRKEKIRCAPATRENLVFCKFYTNAMIFSTVLEHLDRSRRSRLPNGAGLGWAGW